MNSPNKLSAEKAQMRRQVKARRAAFSRAECAAASQNINARLISWLENREKTVALFLALDGEPDLEATARFLLEKGVTVAAPRLDLENQTMRFFALERWENWEIGPFGVRQPFAEHEIEEIPLILVPGLAFDLTGGRLGRGGGWYDRVLPNAGLKVGVAFSWQIVAQVPMEPHDVRVQRLVTENQGISEFSL